MPSACEAVRAASGVDEQCFRLRGHLALLEVLDAICGALPLRFSYGLQNAGLGHATEEIVDGRLPSSGRHIEIDRLCETVGMGESPGSSVPRTHAPR